MSKKIVKRRLEWPLMFNGKSKSTESIRKEIHSRLASLTPGEANSLRARFGLRKMGTADEDDEALHAIARDLAMLKKRKKRG